MENGTADEKLITTTVDHRTLESTGQVITKIKVKDKTEHSLSSVLSSQDLYRTFYKLTEMEFSRNDIDERTLEKLYKFIALFTDTKHLINLQYEETLEDFILEMGLPLEWEIRCLSCVKIKNLEKYQKKYSYFKIYNLFKECVSTIFEKNYEVAYISFVVRLLDNNQLVYKNLLPVITKMNLFVSENILDKCITDCCVVLAALARNCPEYINEDLAIPLISYLIGLFQNPHNFMFLQERDIKIILAAIKTLYRMREIKNTKLVQKIINKCVFKIKEHKGSTVYEEARTLVLMVEIIAYFLEKSKNRNTLFIENFDETFFNFYVIDDHNGERQDSFLTYEYAKMRRLNSQFIVSKYRILKQVMDKYDRLVLFNDLVAIEDPHELFLVLEGWEHMLDWSDLIGLACNSKNKASYIPILFRCYMADPVVMKGYMDIFFEHIKEEYATMVYFSYFGATADCLDVLGKLYALVSASEDARSMQLRKIILIKIGCILENDPNFERNIPV